MIVCVRLHIEIVSTTNIRAFPVDFKPQHVSRIGFVGLSRHVCELQICLGGVENPCIAVVELDYKAPVGRRVRAAGSSLSHTGDSRDDILAQDEK